MSELNQKDIEQLKASYQKQPERDVIARAIQENGINNVARDPKAKSRMQPVFNVEVKTGKVSNQKRSGRCWMFALLNVLKQHVAKKIGVKDFQLSQNYLFFWDKIERANMFYDHMIALAGRSTKDRLVDYYLGAPDDDGGQWDMAVALVEKYGVVPQSVFPETTVTNNTFDFDMVLSLKLRRDAMQLRRLVKGGATDKEIMAARDRMLSEVYRITAYSFGVPPQKFDFEYRDDKKKYHLDRGLTPKEFYKKYVGVDLDDFVVATNSPDKPMGKKYSMPSQDNVVGGKKIEYLNMPMKYLKQAAIKQLKAGEPVWFGNDVIQQMSRKSGYLDSHLFRRAQLFNVNLSMSKADRLAYHEACVSHAMTLTGVDLVNGQPKRWKVQNSWGTKNGYKGYFVMSDDWMNKFVYEMVVRKEYLPKAQRDIDKQAPIALKPWDSLE
ncbi:MAG: aminopeptidase [Acetilactobacillus jinshanensis]